MADSLEMPALYVEGQSDLHTIIHLLARHDIQLDMESGPVVIKDAQSDQGVLRAMRTAAKASTLRPVGFVLDADESVANRWQAARDRVSDLGLEFPETIPQHGYIGDSTVTKSQVGVWIMPDNQLDFGRLEDLVKTLVPDGDELFSLARQSTKQAKSCRAKFKSQHQKKAELHCWLAWQEDPGLSFGTAIKAKYLQHDSETAHRLIGWFRRLFNGWLEK